MNRMVRTFSVVCWDGSTGTFVSELNDTEFESLGFRKVAELGKAPMWIRGLGAPGIFAEVKSFREISS